MHIDRRLPPPVSEEWNWQLFAACRGMDVEIFYHPLEEGRQDRGRRIEHAKEICHNCPVMTECRQHALATREPYGIWGGLSEAERALLLGVQKLRHPALRQSLSRPVPTGDDRPSAQVSGYLSRRPQTDPARRNYPESVEATGIGRRDRFTSTASPADQWKDTHQ